jgi:Mor family transcriptional regulator
MGRKGRPTPAELVMRMIEIGTGEIVRQLAVPETQARVAMREAAHLLCNEYGGQRVYIPQDREYALELRDMQIWHEFNGHNAPELAAQHALTEQQVGNILAHVRRAQLRKTQVRLPGFEEE